MKKYKTILLDQDGVLAKFTSAVIKQVNFVTGQNVTIERAITESKWDLEKLWGMSQKDWWGAIDKNKNFWLEIEPFPWAYDLYHNLQNYCDELVIMTAPSQNPICLAHKLIWLRKYLDVPSRNVMMGKKKYLLARSDTLLIDDSPQNCREFVKNGGNAVCIPSDWNTKTLTFDLVWKKIKYEFNEN